MRVGVLTGGGDRPGVNAVIRAFGNRADRFDDAEVSGRVDEDTAPWCFA